MAKSLIPVAVSARAVPISGATDAPNVILGTPYVEPLDPDENGVPHVRVTIPYEPPNPISTFTRTWAIVESPAVDGEPSTVSDDEDDEFTPEDGITSDTDRETYGPFEDNPDERVIQVRLAVPQPPAPVRIYVPSGSAQRMNPLVPVWETNPTPNVVVDLTDTSTGPNGAEHFPNARNVVARIVRQWKKRGAEQWLQPGLEWEEPVGDQRFRFVKWWDLYVFNPDLIDNTETEVDERIKLITSVPVGTTKWKGTDEWRVPDNPRTLTFHVVPRGYGEARNTITRATGSHADLLVQLLPTSPGQEWTSVISNLKAVHRYVRSEALGLPELPIDITWDEPDDPSYGAGVAYVIVPDGTHVQLSGAEPNPVANVTIENKHLPTSTENWRIYVLSVDANEEPNTYVEGVTPTFPLTIEPYREAVPIENIVGFGMAWDYPSDASGNTHLFFEPSGTTPASSGYGWTELWGIPVSGTDWQYFDGPKTLGKEELVGPLDLPTVAGNWRFRAIVVDNLSFDNDGKKESNPANPPAGTPEVTVYVPLHKDAVPLPNAYDFSVLGGYSVPDANGFRVPQLTAFFNRASNPRIGAFEFWLNRGNGSYEYLDDLDTGGINEILTLTEMPTAEGSWSARLIVVDVNSKDRDGKQNSDGNNPPSGTPTYSFTMPAPPVGPSNQEYALNVILGAGGITATKVSAADGTKRMEIRAPYTAPNDTRWGSAVLVIKTGTDYKEYAPTTAGQIIESVPIPKVTTEIVAYVVSRNKLEKRNSIGIGTPQQTLVIGSTAGELDLSLLDPASTTVLQVGGGGKAEFKPYIVEDGHLKRSGAGKVLIIDADIVAVNGGKLITGSVSTGKLDVLGIDVGGGGDKPNVVRVRNVAQQLVANIGQVGLNTSGNPIYGGHFVNLWVGGNVGQPATAPFYVDTLGNVVIDNTNSPSKKTTFLLRLNGIITKIANEYTTGGYAGITIYEDTLGAEKPLQLGAGSLTINKSLTSTTQVFLAAQNFGMYAPNGSQRSDLFVDNFGAQFEMLNGSNVTTIKLDSATGDVACKGHFNMQRSISTSAGSGGGSYAVPSLCAGFIEVKIDGVIRKIAFHTV